jgi:hypothetical protein
MVPNLEYSQWWSQMILLSKMANHILKKKTLHIGLTKNKKWIFDWISKKKKKKKLHVTALFKGAILFFLLFL